MGQKGGDELYHKGVTRESVIETAVELVEQDGLAGFSMHALAGKLGIKTASLYKHVSGLEDVITEIGLHALRLLSQSIQEQVGDRRGDEALMALARAYRDYAHRHPQLYRTILDMQKMENDTLRRGASVLAESVMEVLDGYGLTDAEKSHWQRILRSMMHGFIAHEEAGYFIHYPEDKEETYEMAIRCVMEGIRHRREE